MTRFPASFQSTHPVRGATSFSFIASATSAHFNPRTPCGVRLIVSYRRNHAVQFQSTHPVRGATPKGKAYGYSQRISIHAPRAGCDGHDDSQSIIRLLFQSTHPVRGATSFYLHCLPHHGISIHAPRAGCDCKYTSRHSRQYISIHAPRAGCDLLIVLAVQIRSHFNPRTPCGVRLHFAIAPLLLDIISIHAPRAGCDGKFDDFNPLNLHKRYKRVLDRPKSTSEQGKNKAKLAYIHVFTVFWGGAKVPELSARFYFAPNTVRLSARPRRHSPLWHRNARCGCDTYPQGSKSADCLRIHP